MRKRLICYITILIFSSIYAQKDLSPVIQEQLGQCFNAFKIQLNDKKLTWKLQPFKFKFLSDNNSEGKGILKKYTIKAIETASDKSKSIKNIEDILIIAVRTPLYMIKHNMLQNDYLCFNQQMQWKFTSLSEEKKIEVAGDDLLTMQVDLDNQGVIRQIPIKFIDAQVKSSNFELSSFFILKEDEPHIEQVKGVIYDVESNKAVNVNILFDK